MATAVAAAAAGPAEQAPSMEMLLDMTVEAPFMFIETTETQLPPAPPPAPAQPLIHRLMENVEAPKELDRVYDRDYLALRYRAFTNRKGGTDPWKGATVLEKQLIFCVDEDGALRRDRVIHFISHITECSRSWALPLAILERSQKEDEEDAKLAEVSEKKIASEASRSTKKAKRGKRKRDEDEDSDYSEKGFEDEDEEDGWLGQGDVDDMKMAASSSSGSVQNLQPGDLAQNQSFETKTVTEMSPQVVKVQKPSLKPPRMELFVQLGGLKILSIWLEETRDPETKTGSLMLPLLALVAKVPFSFQAIERSKINKTISSIKKEIKKLKALDKVPQVHAVSGNNPVADVLNSLNKIIRLWKEKTEANKKLPQTMENPLAEFQENMKNHIRKIEEERAKRLSTNTSQAAIGGKHKGVLSVREREKLERFIESEAHIRRDLEKVQRDRAEALRKFRESQARREPPKPPPRIGSQSVRWKDGLRTGKAIPELLLSIREFNKYQTAAGGDVPVDPEEEAKRRANKASKEGSDSLLTVRAIVEQHEELGIVPADPEMESKRRAINSDGEIYAVKASIHHDMADQPLRHGRYSAQYFQPKPMDLSHSRYEDSGERAADVNVESLDERQRAAGFKSKKRFKKRFKKPVPESTHPSRKKTNGGRKKKHFNKWNSDKH